MPPGRIIAHGNAAEYALNRGTAHLPDKFIRQMGCPSQAALRFSPGE